MAKTRLFTKEFLEELYEKCGALTMVDHYINEDGMNFHDAILRFSNFHNMIPQYVEDGYSRSLDNSETFFKMLKEIRKLEKEKDGTSPASSTAE